MPAPSTLLVFALASAALIALPGPAVVYIISRSVSQGRTAGVVSALGVEVGALVHVAAATIGLSALVASSAAAFNVVKLAGAAYLIVLGLQRLRSPSGAPFGSVPPATRRALFGQGIVVNALNPKVAIFFLAFLPQFVVAGHAVAPQIALLGAIFVTVAVVLDLTWALTAGTLGLRLRRSARARRLLDRTSGVAFLGLGGVAALAHR